MIRNVRSRLAETVGRVFGRAQEQRPLPVDLFESDDAFLAVFDAPGAHPADIEVTFEHNSIVVQVDRFRDFYDGYETEFPGRGLTLDGHVDLPGDVSVDPSEGSATVRENGTLHVHVPKVSPTEDTASETDDETDTEDQ